VYQSIRTDLTLSSLNKLLRNINHTMNEAAVLKKHIFSDIL